MIERINSQANIESMLQTLRSVQAQASADLPTPAAVAGQSERVQSPHFGDLIKNAVDQVNVAQTCRNRHWPSKPRCKSATR
jgi:flagellar hook-basal body complex protein FliE